jgi:hypothetical protein
MNRLSKPQEMLSKCGTNLVQTRQGSACMKNTLIYSRKGATELIIFKGLLEFKNSKSIEQMQEGKSIHSAF